MKLNRTPRAANTGGNGAGGITLTRVIFGCQLFQSIFRKYVLIVVTQDVNVCYFNFRYCIAPGAVDYYFKVQSFFIVCSCFDAVTPPGYFGHGDLILLLIFVSPENSLYSCN